MTSHQVLYYTLSGLSRLPVRVKPALLPRSVHILLSLGSNHTADYLPTPAIGFTYVHVSGHSFPALYMEIPTGLLVSPIHSAAFIMINAAH